MNLKKRLLYYGLVFGMGLVFVLLFFNLRGCEWLPDNRVISAIKSSQIIITNNNNCKLDCNKITPKDIFLLIDNGDVDFSKSNTKARKKQYFISDNNLELTFELYPFDSTAEIININEKIDCSCNNNDSIIKLYKPNNMMLKELNLKALKKQNLFSCQFECLNLDTNIIYTLLNEGEILFKESLPNRKPNPL